MITLTMACSIVGFALTAVQANNGAGRRRGDVPPDVYQYGMFINFINQPIYLFAICFVKLAVGAALMRIASIRNYKYAIMGVMGFVSFYTIACFFVGTSQSGSPRVDELTTCRQSYSSAPTSRSYGTRQLMRHVGLRAQSGRYHTQTRPSTSSPTCCSL